jgi:hypothetical protein
MAADIHSREQRLRKQAELQSLYLNLANLREREASYIAASAAIPELLVNQINEQRQKIQGVEDELLALADDPGQSPTPGRPLYREALEAELSGDLEKAQKLYRSAARASHPDGDAAGRSVRYRIRISKSRPVAAGQSWGVASGSRNRWLIAVALILILVLLVIFVMNGISSRSSQQVTSIEPTVTATSTPPEVILIVPDTPTAALTNTPLPTETSTNTPQPTPAEEDEALPTSTPAPSPTLGPAPRILEPKDGLVWLDGAIVFELAEMDLAYDELYCLNTLRGYDQTLTENWSFPPTGSKKRSIVIEANVFRVAKAQEIECIVWSAAIGKETCENIISQSTEERVIGLPRPCDFK